MGKKFKAKRSPASSPCKPGQALRGVRASEQYVDVHAPEAATGRGLDRHRLYESAVQSPKGDISYLLSFHHQYIGSKVTMRYVKASCCLADASIAC